MRRILLFTVSVCLAQESSPESLIEAGHWKRARRIVEQRLRESPDDPNANYLASQIRNAFGDRSSPLELAEKAVRLAPGVARYHRQLAEVYGVTAQHAGMFQQMLLARKFRKEIDTAIFLDARDAQAQRDLLEYYVLAPGVLGGDTKKAELAAARIEALNQVEGFLAGARLAEIRKNQPQMLAMLQRATAVHPPSYKAQMALAQFYFAPEHRDDAAAEAAARTALNIDAGRAGAYCVIAAVSAGRGDWNALEDILASASRQVADDRAPYYRAAERLLESGGDTARAERYLSIYLGREPEGNQPGIADAHNQLARALSTQGKDADAHRERKIAQKLNSDR